MSTGSIVILKLTNILINTNLFANEGAKWTRRRKMLTPAFHFKILEDFMHVFNSEGQKMMKILKKDCGKDNIADVGQYITRCTLDIICGKRF